jgi:hypothetical protein
MLASSTAPTGVIAKCSAARGFGVNHGGIDSFRVLDNLSKNRLFLSSVLVAGHYSIAVTHDPDERKHRDVARRRWQTPDKP